MAKNVLHELPALVEAGVISEEVAGRIRQYYQQREPSHRLFTVFSMLGALLAGLGVILLVAHNWDELTRLVKTGLVFLLLLTGQAACLYVRLRKPGSTSWRESAAAFLFLAVGASIALISQIYHIPGNLTAFILTWMLLCLPLVYTMPSSVVSMLYIIGITCYACERSYWSYPSATAYLYWGLLLGVVPYYYALCRRKADSPLTALHHWLVPLSVVTALGTLSRTTEELMMVAYMSLFALLYLAGNIPFLKEQKTANNGYLVTGAAGTLILLLILSFHGFWQHWHEQDFAPARLFGSVEFVAAFVLSLLAGVFLYRLYRDKPWYTIDPAAYVFILFAATFALGVSSAGAAILLVNLLVLLLGTYTVVQGAGRQDLKLLNYGLLIILVLAVCRFFDTDLSFALRGSLFVLAGTGFFLINYSMFRKIKANKS